MVQWFETAVANNNMAGNLWENGSLLELYCHFPAMETSNWDRAMPWVVADN